jgi:hypothetical protein
MNNIRTRLATVDRPITWLAKLLGTSRPTATHYAQSDTMPDCAAARLDAYIDGHNELMRSLPALDKYSNGRFIKTKE